MNNLFTIESLWESDAKGYAKIAGRAIGLNEEQVEALEACMDDAIRNVSRETAREVYYENK